MKCVNCDNNKSSRAIVMGLPVSFCTHCLTMWGFWSYAYTFLFAPLEGWLNGGFSFMLYEGSYWNALKRWLCDDYV